MRRVPLYMGVKYGREPNLTERVLVTTVITGLRPFGEFQAMQAFFIVQTTSGLMLPMITPVNFIRSGCIASRMKSQFKVFVAPISPLLEMNSYLSVVGVFASPDQSFILESDKNEV